MIKKSVMIMYDGRLATPAGVLAAGLSLLPLQGYIYIYIYIYVLYMYICIYTHDI